MKRTLFVALATTLTASVTTPAQVRPDLSGEWSFAPHLTPLAQRELAPLATLIVKQTATEISFEAKDFQQDQAPVIFALDGRESLSTDRSSSTKGRAVWEGSALVVTGTRAFTTAALGDTAIDFKDVYRLENGVLIVDKSESQGGRAVASYKSAAAYKIAYTRGPYLQPPMPPNTSTTPGSDGSCPKDSALFRQCAMERLKSYRPPRTADGRPDFEGYWRIAGQLTSTNPGEHIEAQPMSPLAGGPGGRSLVIDPPDGRVPLQPWAKTDREWRMRGENAILDPLVVSCNGGIPRTYTYSLNHWIRTKDAFLVLYEMHHDYRVIAMDGRPPLKANVGGLWRGSSRGRWEGDTLIVETQGFNGKSYVDMQFVPMSADARLVERFTRVADDIMLFEATITDPKLYTQSWTMVGPLRREAQPNFEILESACHEDNRQLSDEGVLRRTADLARIKREAESRSYLAQQK